MLLYKSSYLQLQLAYVILQEGETYSV